MQALKIILFSFLGIIILLLIISFFLSSGSRVSRSMQMKAKPGQVFQLVNNFKNWPQWSPWHKKDTTAVYTYNDIPEGIGSGFTWKSNNSEVGSGSMTIINVLPDRKWQAEMTMNGMGTSNADFNIEPNDSGIKVTWVMESDGKGMPFYWKPLSKYMNLFIEKMVGPDFEEGLNNIKNIVEQAQANVIMIAGFEAEIKELPSMKYIGIRGKLKGAEIGLKLNEFYTQLMGEMKKQGVEQAGAPFTINYSANADTYDMEACIPVKGSMLVGGFMRSGNNPATKALVIKYYGNYVGTGLVYQPGFDYLSHNNLKVVGAPMEFYITDPIIEKDTAKWLTEVVLPCN